MSLPKLKKLIRTLVEESFSDKEQAKILDTLIKAAKENFGEITPPNEAKDFSLTIYPGLSKNGEDYVSLYFNDSTGSTHLEQYNELKM